MATFTPFYQMVGFKLWMMRMRRRIMKSMNLRMSRVYNDDLYGQHPLPVQNRWQTGGKRVENLFYAFLPPFGTQKILRNFLRTYFFTFFHPFATYRWQKGVKCTQLYPTQDFTPFFHLLQYQGFTVYLTLIRVFFRVFRVSCFPPVFHLFSTCFTQHAYLTLIRVARLHILHLFYTYFRVFLHLMHT